MVGDSPNYHEGGPPQGAQKLPPIRRENDCDIGGSTASWREIFAVDGAGAGSISPTLGVNFMRAAQNTRTIKYSLAACRGGSSKDSCSEYATLTLGQDLRNLGLGAVVWDCVSMDHFLHVQKPCILIYHEQHYCVKYSLVRTSSFAHRQRGYGEW